MNRAKRCSAKAADIKSDDDDDDDLFLQPKLLLLYLSDLIFSYQPLLLPQLLFYIAVV